MGDGTLRVAVDASQSALGSGEAGEERALASERLGRRELMGEGT